MAYRLGQYVTYGELFTTSHYGVFGFLVLRTESAEAGGEQTFIRLELTGDPEPDLQNMHLCFEPEEGAEIAYFRSSEHPSLHERQFGATGTMTARGWVRTLPCPVAEFTARARLGEPPPTTWKNQLYLEWFGPDGRMVVELAGALIEVCTREPDESKAMDWGDWEPLPNPEPPPESWAADTSPGDISITTVHADGKTSTSSGLDPLHEDGLDLARVLGCAAQETVRGGVGKCEWPTDCRSGDGHRNQANRLPILRALCDSEQLPHPDDLGETEVEAQLKLLLARLARLGVAFHVCDHCMPRDAYRLLRDRILPELGVDGAPADDGAVRQFMVSEYCHRCAAEASGEPGAAVWN